LGFGAIDGGGFGIFFGTLDEFCPCYISGINDSENYYQDYQFLENLADHQDKSFYHIAHFASSGCYKLVISILEKQTKCNSVNCALENNTECDRFKGPDLSFKVSITINDYNYDGDLIICIR